MPESAYKQYVDSLKRLAIGKPIYHPDGEGLKPGHCGYFDDNGKWKHMLDLTAIDAHHPSYTQLASPLVIGGLTAPQQWGPQFGSTVRCCGVEQVTSLEIPGLPVTPGVNLKFEKSSKYGAVLMTDPVTYTSFPHKPPFHQWCKANASALLADKTYGPELKEHHLFIVTEVYSTPRCSIVQWEDTTKEISIGVSAEAWGAGKLTGSGFWNKITNLGTWRGFGFEEENEPSPLDICRHRGVIKERISESFDIRVDGNYYTGQGAETNLTLPSAIPEPLPETVSE
ncbi:MAG: hypothetical protein M1834_002811 [Cirrosporium novae-zelandiae]|nr:MAG: hypothetical protein M1834_002811 [Cirrosporium novae-zelandiae]